MPDCNNKESKNCHCFYQVLNQWSILVTNIVTMLIEPVYLALSLASGYCRGMVVGVTRAHSQLECFYC